MIETICKEILLTPNFAEEEIIETVYIGGGTPSLLSPENLKSIFDTLYKKFTIKKDAEITLEANPDDINLNTLNDWLSAGINRLSVGLQSFNEAELKWMNRAHNSAQSLQCLEDITLAGFSDYSVDLIYGSPLQTNADLEKNFNIIAERNVPHISCYALTVEPGTALNKLIVNNKSLPVNTDTQAEQFYLLLSMMEKAGYEQYEISNFSKSGHRSMHNSSYWKAVPYYGFGPSAHSFDGKTKRKWNVSNNALYLQAIDKNMIPYEEEILTDAQRLNEYIMTSLRTAEGLNIDFVEKNYGKENTNRILKDAEKYLQSQRIRDTGKSLILTREGKFFADGIAADLFG